MGKPFEIRAEDARALSNADMLRLVQKHMAPEVDALAKAHRVINGDEKARDFRKRCDATADEAVALIRRLSNEDHDRHDGACLITITDFVRLT